MDLKMTRGDSKRIALALPDASGNPLDLTDASVWMTAKEAFTDTDDAATFQKTIGAGITVLDEDNGVILVELDPEDTSTLDAVRTRLVYDIQVKDADDAISTPISGKLTVYPDVTITISEGS